MEGEFTRYSRLIREGRERADKVFREIAEKRSFDLFQKHYPEFMELMSTRLAEGMTPEAIRDYFAAWEREHGAGDALSQTAYQCACYLARIG